VVNSSANRAGLRTDLAVLRAQFDAFILSSGKALELQAEEYSRRLDHLNNEQSRMANFVPRELLERYLEVDREWKAKLDEKITLMDTSLVPRTEFSMYRDDTLTTLNRLTGSRQGQNSLLTVGLSVIVAIGGIGALLFSIFKG